jgi:outer membrane biogenesis lipoprotein LolB
MKRRTLLLLPAGLLLAACTSLPEGVRERRGRFSLQKTGYGAPEQFTGRFTLRTGPDLLRLDILTPLSGVIARIESTSRGATISRGLDEVIARGDSPEALMEETLGFSIPVSTLEAWLDGRPRPDALPAETWRDGDWSVRVNARQPDSTPSRILAVYENQGVKVRLTLLLDPPAS